MPTATVQSSTPGSSYSARKSGHRAGLPSLPFVSIPSFPTLAIVKSETTLRTKAEAAQYIATRSTYTPTTINGPSLPEAPCIWTSHARWKNCFVLITSPSSVLHIEDNLTLDFIAERASPAPLQNDGDNIEIRGEDWPRKAPRAAWWNCTLARAGTGEFNPTTLPCSLPSPSYMSLICSLYLHGISLNALYSRSEQTKPVGTPVVIKDDDNMEYCRAADVVSMAAENCMFHFPPGKKFLWRYSNTKFSMYKIIGTDDYVALCEPDYLGFRGGDGPYGLYVDKSLLEGSSARYMTFGNDVLCSPGRMRAGGAVPFEFVRLEVLRVG
ncbi:hypothetical protein EDD18DRAFT_1334028 [Armillaria luteobubalina]|uniref:Oxidation resistance protein 1 n=1 Tax=Armillaria luteobubalina TaxID=153913 RepID=A0AA39PYI7_9AGAR|nr:hypothetical protein EDD18DRAFT_1334028 [Armillaria luteobubalina]